MFCVATAPTPALAKAQRADTAGEEEEIATPNFLVVSQRATSEKVMRLIRNDGGAVNFDDPVGPGKRGNHQPCRDRVHPF